MSKKVKIPPEGFTDWMDGYCEAFEDLSDGAWQSACMTGVEDYNKEHGTRIDPHELWLYWATEREYVK